MELDASSCARLTDAGAAQLANHGLERLSLAGCRLLTEAALDHLARCPNLVRYEFLSQTLITLAPLLDIKSPTHKHDMTLLHTVASF